MFYLRFNDEGINNMNKIKLSTKLHFLHHYCE